MGYLPDANFRAHLQNGIVGNGKERGNSQRVRRKVHLPDRTAVRSFSMKRSTLLRYGVATLAVAVVLLLKLLLDPLIADQSPFLLLAGAVMVAAWFGGMGPGLLATVLGALAADYYFLPPLGAVTGLGLGFLPVFLFALQGLLISSLAEALRAARGRAEASAHEARSHQESLRQSEERFRLLIEGVEDYAIFILDPEGRVATWNAGAKRINGYDEDEIIGEHFSIFYTDGDVERGHPDEELQVAAAEGRYEEEGVRVRKDGSTFWANVVITALRDEAGNLRGYAKVTRDITARKDAEERERLLAREQAARERATVILESISDAFFAVDREWHFTYVNSKAEELWGRSREELLGKNIWEEFPQAEDSESYRQIRRAMEEGLTTEFETISPVLGNWVVGRAYPSREGLSVYFQDVTERGRAEEEIRRSEERYRSFVEQSTEGLWRFELEEPIAADVPEEEQIERFYRHAYLAECNDMVARMYGLLTRRNYWAHAWGTSCL